MVEMVSFPPVRNSWCFTSHEKLQNTFIKSEERRTEKKLAPFETTAQLGRVLSRCEGWIAAFGKLKDVFLRCSKAICISNSSSDEASYHTSGSLLVHF